MTKNGKVRFGIFLLVVLAVASSGVAKYIQQGEHGTAFFWAVMVAVAICVQFGIEKLDARRTRASGKVNGSSQV